MDKYEDKNIIKCNDKDKRQSDIWIIYRDPEHLKDGLDLLTGVDPETKKRKVKFTKENPIIIFVNLVSKFIIGDEAIERPIGTYLYSKETNISLMLASARYTDPDLGLISATEEDIINYFEKEGIPYEVVFGHPIEAIDNPNINELWIARDKSVLDDSLKENIDNNVSECVYYPNCPSSLSVGYYITEGENQGKFIEIFGFNGRGVIVSDFNWALLVQEGYIGNLTEQEVIETLNNLGYNYTICEEENIKIPKGKNK